MGILTNSDVLVELPMEGPAVDAGVLEAYCGGQEARLPIAPMWAGAYTAIERWAARCGGG